MKKSSPDDDDKPRLGGIIPPKPPNFAIGGEFVYTDETQDRLLRKDRGERERKLTPPNTNQENSTKSSLPTAFAAAPPFQQNGTSTITENTQASLLEKDRLAREQRVPVAVPLASSVVEEQPPPPDEEQPSENKLPHSLVAESETVPPIVLWQPEHRKFTDKRWAVVFGLCYIAFLSTGFVLVANSKARYERDEATDMRIVSSHYRDDVNDCCQKIGYQEDDFTFDLCWQLGASGNRRLSAGESRFDGDEGIFDAFLEAPQIIVGLLSSTIVLSLLWVVLLRFFATPIVFATEAIKVGIFIYMGVVSEDTGTLVVCIMIAIGIIVFDIWARKKLLFAGKVISYSAKALKNNPAMFVGLICVKLFYALNAFLFVLFFSKSFDVVEVKEETNCYGSDCISTCEFVSPNYVIGIARFLCLAYLWIILWFSKIRLAIIANVVGSWHFHPENKPTIARAVINSCTTSTGTLAVASLISTIAERINRILQEPWWSGLIGCAACVTLPLQIVLCVFGSCITMFIKMMTKFAVVLHVFTGLPFVGSGKKVIKILSRHFKGGFVIENSSNSVLMLGAYVFSLAISLLAWAWFDFVFNTNTLPGGSDASYVILWILFGLFNLWYPVLGIYIIILLNRFLKLNGNFQHTWVSPLAAIFVGCIAMMFFTYVAGIILDTIDVLFLCFSIDKDNQVDLSDDDLVTIASSVSGYIDNVNTGELTVEQITVTTTTTTIRRNGN